MSFSGFDLGHTEELCAVPLVVGSLTVFQTRHYLLSPSIQGSNVENKFHILSDATISEN